MTAQGQPLTRYRRAVKGGNVFLAELAAREAGHLPLSDALALLSLYAAQRSPKYEKAAVRWLARLALERRETGLAEVQLAAAALELLPAPHALDVLTNLAR